MKSTAENPNPPGGDVRRWQYRRLNRSTTTTARFSLGLLAVLIGFVGLEIFGALAQRGVDRAADRTVRLARDIEQIRYYDELLTMSARLAAATGDLSYVQRYREAIPMLDLVIADAFTLVPDPAAQVAVSETAAANRVLVALEESSFTLLAAGDRRAAYEQLTGSRYVELKAAYAEGMSVALRLLIEADKAAANRLHRQQTLSLVAATLAAAMLGLMWFRTSVGLNRSRERLQKSGESKDEFLASVSHELRTPLTAVVGYSSILHSDWASMDDDDRQTVVGLIYQQSTEMARLVDNLLVATRLEHGELTVSRVPVQMMKEMKSVLAALPAPDQSTLRLAVPESIRAIGDPIRIRQVFRNLITNAYRYGGTAIVVDASTINDTTVLSVTDDGHALPRGDWELVFEPYYHSSDRRGLTDSVGLGLTISRRLAREMGGDLVYRGTDNASVFSLSLPAAFAALSLRPAQAAA